MNKDDYIRRIKKVIKSNSKKIIIRQIDNYYNACNYNNY